MIRVAVFLLASALAVPANATGSVENAYRICALADRTGLTSEPCSVSGWNSSVRITLDMSASEARKTCLGLADLARENGWRFAKGWKLEFYSPYSNRKSIAYCPL